MVHDLERLEGSDLLRVDVTGGVTAFVVPGWMMNHPLSKIDVKAYIFATRLIPIA